MNFSLLAHLSTPMTDEMKMNRGHIRLGAGGSGGEPAADAGGAGGARLEWAVGECSEAADAVIDGACAKMGKTREQLAPVLGAVGAL